MELTLSPPPDQGAAHDSVAPVFSSSQQVENSSCTLIIAAFVCESGVCMLVLIVELAKRCGL